MSIFHIMFFCKQNQPSLSGVFPSCGLDLGFVTVPSQSTIPSNTYWQLAQMCFLCCSLRLLCIDHKSSSGSSAEILQATGWSRCPGWQSSDLSDCVRKDCVKPLTPLLPFGGPPAPAGNGRAPAGFAEIPAVAVLLQVVDPKPPGALLECITVRDSVQSSRHQSI